MKQISVIIPVYNVEKYLEKCVYSILNQTLEADEIILVNDGSTDKSGEICNRLESENERIRVLNKENGGLSDARNYGVKNSNGQYITFIDSDDYVRCDYLELLYKGLKKNNADISVVNHQSVYENSKDETKQYKDTAATIEVMDGKQILKYALLGEKGSLSAWAKLYKRGYVVENPFPVGKLYEDMEIIYNIYLKATKIAIINEKAYYYLQRDNSIVHSKITEKHLYGIKSCINMLENNNRNNYGLEEYIKCRIAMQSCGHLPNLVRYNEVEMFEEISSLVRIYIKEILFGKEATIKLKIRSFTYLLSSKMGLVYAKGFLYSKKAFKNIKNKVVNK